MALPYPPWWLERAAGRKAELDASVERLRALLPTLPSIHGALLFGSYARDTVGPDSDLDLIVIQETDEPILSRGTELRGPLFEALRVPYDLIVYSPTEYERFSRELSFVAQARDEGIWIPGAVQT